MAQNTRWKLEVIFGGTNNGLMESKTRSIKSKKTTLVASFGESALPFMNLVLNVWRRVSFRQELFSVGIKYNTHKV